MVEINNGRQQLLPLNQTTSALQNHA